MRIPLILLLSFCLINAHLSVLAQTVPTYITVPADNEILFNDNGQIRSRDINHRILFRRTENIMELREFGDIIFSSGAVSSTETAKMVVFANGNVCIGTTFPQGKLAVNGDIYAKKVKVTQTGWPDYVFNASYRLRPLSEVEQYIKQYGHLPEVVSVEEVEKNGLDVGDNQATLLKKIEELTLYVIEQQKQIKKLENENSELTALKKEMEEIKAVVQQMRK